jgi:hypothetical protein
VDAVFCQSGLRRVGPGTVPHAASRVRVPVIPRPGRRRDSWEHRAPRGSACRPHPLAPSPSLERGNQWRAPLTQGSALGSHLAPFQGLSAPGSPAGRLWRAGGWRARSAAGPSLKVTGRVTACSFLSDTTPAAASGARDDTTAALSPAVPFLPPFLASRLLSPTSGYRNHGWVFGLSFVRAYPEVPCGGQVYGNGVGREAGV